LYCRTFLFGIYGMFCWTHRRGIVGRTPMSPLWLSAHAHIIYSLIKEWFNCETMGIYLLAKLQSPCKKTAFPPLYNLPIHAIL
jgi:hypothetical protein